MADKAEILAAVEMASEGLGLDALIDVIKEESGKLMYFGNGWAFSTSEGIVMVTSSESGWVVS